MATTTDLGHGSGCGSSEPDTLLWLDGNSSIAKIAATLPPLPWHASAFLRARPPPSLTLDVGSSTKPDAAYSTMCGVRRRRQEEEEETLPSTAREEEACRRTDVTDDNVITTVK
jgi:hypothetical protein